MNKLVKVSAHDCVICAQLSYHDVSIAEDEQMAMEVIELEDLAQAEGTDVYNYVVNYHLEGDGSIVVPVYLILEDEKTQASGAIKEHTELKNLIDAWKTWKNAQPEN